MKMTKLRSHLFVTWGLICTVGDLFCWTLKLINMFNNAWSSLIMLPVFYLDRRFIWPTYESGPLDHQRSGNPDAWRDAYFTTELWVINVTMQWMTKNYFCTPFMLCVLTFASPSGRNIFLGETFSSYISVHNDSNQIVKDILVKVLSLTLFTWR